MGSTLQTHIGIKGIVSNPDGSPLANALVRVAYVTDKGQNQVINHGVTSGNYILQTADLVCVFHERPRIYHELMQTINFNTYMDVFFSTLIQKVEF